LAPPERRDEIAHLITLAAASSVLLITVLLVAELYGSSALSRGKLVGVSCFRGLDPVAESFGALPFIYGTVVTSLVALLIAVPMGLGAAIFLAELAPPKISDASPSSWSCWRPCQRDLRPAGRLCAGAATA